VTARLVLASTSPFRKALLLRVGVAFVAEKPSFDELAEPGEQPRAMALRFARGKAHSLAKTAPPDTWVLGCDQALELEGVALRKAPTGAEMAAQLAQLQGRTHHLHNALVLRRGGLDPSHEWVSETSVALTMRALSTAEISAYLERDKPHGAVGAYLYEQNGFALFDKVVGSDDSAIVGLPLTEVCGLLRRAGLLS
jgi:septum formation protein